VKITDHVHRIGTDSTVNAYLLEEGGEVTIIDAAMPATTTTSRASWQRRSLTATRLPWSCAEIEGRTGPRGMRVIFRIGLC
jgi:hypothetical protein